MNPHDIKALLGKRGVRQVDIAKRLKVTPTAVGQVIFGRSKSQRIADAVAQSIGCEAHQIWPKVYPRASSQ